MAYNVFGNPITNSTLEGMPEYVGKTITRLDRAHVALNMKNAEEKDRNAREYVEKLKQQWGTGVSTLCLIYNATGDPIKFVTSHDWWGHLGPAPYPTEIANGQWGGFLHVKTSGTATGSTGCCVYRGLNNAGSICDWMAAWSNPWNRDAWDNMVYTEIREKGHYTENNHWNYIKDLLYKSGLNNSDTWNGCVSTVSTGSSTSPVFEAQFTLSGA